nr:unnamed protein product [Rangifer tarandus platyrhynchus]
MCGRPARQQLVPPRRPRAPIDTHQAAGGRERPLPRAPLAVVPGPPALGLVLFGGHTLPAQLKSWSGARRGRVPASPRPPVGGALVMHYSSLSSPPAASLAFPARAAGCAEERERGAFTILWQLRE